MGFLSTAHSLGMRGGYGALGAMGTNIAMDRDTSFWGTLAAGALGFAAQRKGMAGSYGRAGLYGSMAANIALRDDPSFFGTIGAGLLGAGAGRYGAMGVGAMRSAIRSNRGVLGTLGSGASAVGRGVKMDANKAVNGFNALRGKAGTLWNHR